MKRQYDAFTDEELIEQLRDGDSAVMDFLMEKYKYLVRKKANAVFLLGGDTDDLVQEGMIGLFKAVRDFDSKKSSFFHFAELCISRQIYHAIEAAGRKKHVPLNAYVSLSGSDMDSETVPLEDSLNSPQDNPEQKLIDQETVAAFLQECARKEPEMYVALYADESIPYREIVRVLKIENEIHFKMVLASRRPDKN